MLTRSFILNFAPYISKQKENVNKNIYLKPCTIYPKKEANDNKNIHIDL